MQQTQQQQLRQQQPQFQQMPDFNANLLGMPSIPGSGRSLAAMSAQPGLFQTGSPNQPESGGSDISFEHDDQFSLDHNTGSSNGRRTNSKLHARDTKTKRNPKQQMQNKQAQQRYRCVWTPALSAYSVSISHLVIVWGIMTKDIRILLDLFLRPLICLFTTILCVMRYKNAVLVGLSRSSVSSNMRLSIDHRLTD